MKSTGTGAELGGVDVSLDHLDVGIWPSGQTFGDSNDAPGRKRLAQRLAELKVRLVVMESTGKMGVPLALELDEHQVPYRTVNARQVRDFARATGRLAKTGKIDALVLAHFGEAMRVAPKALPDAGRRELKAIVMRRAQLIENRVAENNRLRDETDPYVIKSLGKSIAWHEREIALLDGKLDRTVKGNAEFAALSETVQSIPGVGPQTARINLPAFNDAQGRIEGELRHCF